jgi:hypothetical protein
MSDVNKKIKEIASSFEAVLTKDFMQKRYLAPIKNFVLAHKAFLEKEGVEASIISFASMPEPSTKPNSAPPSPLLFAAKTYTRRFWLRSKRMCARCGIS